LAGCSISEPDHDLQLQPAIALNRTSQRLQKVTAKKMPDLRLHNTPPETSPCCLYNMPGGGTGC
jgi:hypothetical protein